MRSWLAVALTLAACAPAIDTPADRQRAVDREDGDRLARLLETVPGVVHARVELHRSVVDPFTQRASPAAAAVVLVGEAPAATVRELVHAAVPDVPPPTIIAMPSPVAAPPRDDKPVLGAALALLALAAGFVAWRERPYARRGSSAQ